MRVKAKCPDCGYRDSYEVNEHNDGYTCRTCGEGQILVEGMDYVLIPVYSEDKFAEIIDYRREYVN